MECLRQRALIIIIKYEETFRVLRGLSYFTATLPKLVIYHNFGNINDAPRLQFFPKNTSCIFGEISLICEMTNCI